MFSFLKMKEQLLELLDSMGFDSLDSVGQTVETMADVTNDAEELSTTSRVGDLLNKI